MDAHDGYGKTVLIMRNYLAMTANWQLSTGCWKAGGGRCRLVRQSARQEPMGLPKEVDGDGLFGHRVEGDQPKAQGAQNAARVQ